MNSLLFMFESNLAWLNDPKVNVSKRLMSNVLAYNFLDSSENIGVS